MNPEKLFKLAKIVENDNKQKALDYYQQVIDDFPNTEHARLAKSKIITLNESDTLGSVISDYIEQSKEYNERIKQIILTTAPSIEGYRIEETIEIVTAECVYGVNAFRDFFSGMTDFFGGRSSANQKVLRDARLTCLSELKVEANMVGANAVIAVKLDYSEISGGGKSMLFLVASGTAVKISKTPEMK
jgi:uncharacterized protein YbjQ (UPF0145 family)